MLNDVANVIRQREQILVHSGDDFGKIVPVDGWSGAASDSAVAAHQALMKRVEPLAAVASAVGKALGQASDAILAVQRAIVNAEELARKYGYSVGNSSEVTDTLPAGAAPPEMNQTIARERRPKWPTRSLRRCIPRTTSTATWKVPEGHICSEWPDKDIVPRLDVANVFGVYPYQGISAGTLSDVQQLSTGDVVGADGAHHITHEHGQYVDNDSTSQYNMASIVAGRPDMAVRYVQPWDVPSPPPTPGQPIPAPPGRDPQPPPLPPR